MLIIPISAPAVIWLALRDRAGRSVIVLYDVNEAVHAAARLQEQQDRNKARCVHVH
ncbi:hypothetical protein [Nonomuraea sp. NPDC048916]|uniref:hypothetical protein n=1 Tax=Nonomuraea sp. NPDC048916 TaxID=3154232 RepID=UPI0033C5B4DE